MVARFILGDVFDRMAELDDASFDLILTSPPFLALRSYLPDGHPDKAKEIGSEATPAEFIDTMLRLTAEWRRLLAPHGSIAVEIGDTYAGSGGAGGDYGPDGLRAGQPRFRQNNLYTSGYSGGAHGLDTKKVAGNIPLNAGPGWPLDKSLCGIPHLYAWSLAYGRNLLTGQPSPAGQWRVRNVKPWIRSNPPVGALGDKERPATSYVVVACVARDRWFDLDAVRTAHVVPEAATPEGARVKRKEYNSLTKTMPVGKPMMSNAAGAPPLDWWHTVDAIIDNVIDQRNGKSSDGPRTTNGPKSKLRGDEHPSFDVRTGVGAVGARGVHIRRALETAGILTTLDAIDISPRGYSGSHYAVWPKELVKLLVKEMCPRFVCPCCGPLRSLESSHDAASLRDMQRADHQPVSEQSDGREAPVLFPEMRHDRQTRGPESGDGGAGLPPEEPSVRLRGGALAGAPDGQQVGLAVRASSDNGGAPGPDVDSERSGAPQERSAERQPPREPGTDDPGRAPEGADSAVEAEALPALRGDGVGDRACPSCGSELRRGHVLDPFVGSGTTLAVCSGLARDATGIDIDERNALLARERVGLFLEVDDQHPDEVTVTSPLLDGDPQ